MASLQGSTAEAILTLTLMRGKKTPQTRAYAASVILDRGHGKPPEGHTGEGVKLRTRRGSSDRDIV
jgi:hypothetical protein